MHIAVLYGLVFLIWSAVAIADCEGGTAAEQLQCLQQQHCPEAASDAELASCYRSISLQLLSQQQVAIRPAPAAVSASPQAPALVPLTPRPAAEAAPAVAAQQPAPVAQQPAPITSPAPAANPEDGFGLPALPVEKVEPESISAVIVRVKKQPRGNYLIALDNGQLWQENEPSKSHLRKGQHVRIVKGQLNSYKLIPEKSRSTGVNRIECRGSEPDPRCAMLDS